MKKADGNKLEGSRSEEIFLETMSMEGAASNLSEVYNYGQQLWEVIIDIVKYLSSSESHYTQSIPPLLFRWTGGLICTVFYLVYSLDPHLTSLYIIL